MWDKIYINLNSFELSTSKAFLINMPKKSNYKGYSFWHPAKLVRCVGQDGNLYSLSFTNEFIFKLQKRGKGRYNFNKVLGEVELDSQEIKEAFGFVEGEILDDLKD